MCLLLFIILYYNNNNVPICTISKNINKLLPGIIYKKKLIMKRKEDSYTTVSNINYVLWYTYNICGTISKRYHRNNII